MTSKSLWGALPVLQKGREEENTRFDAVEGSGMSRDRGCGRCGADTVEVRSLHGGVEAEGEVS